MNMTDRTRDVLKTVGFIAGLVTLIVVMAYDGETPLWRLWLQGLGAFVADSPALRSHWNDRDDIIEVRTVQSRPLGHRTGIEVFTP